MLLNLQHANGSLCKFILQILIEQQMYAELPCHGKAHLMQPKAEHVQDKKEKLAAALNWLPCNPFATVRCRFALPVWSRWKPTTTICTNESFQKSTSITVESNAICFYFLPPTAMLPPCRQKCRFYPESVPRPFRFSNQHRFLQSNQLLLEEFKFQSHSGCLREKS